MGPEAKQAPKNPCSAGWAALDADDLESRDKYGRLLGYLWCLYRKVYFEDSSARLG